MMSRKSGHPTPRRTTARLLLALLLALAPVLTFAGGTPPTASADRDVIDQPDQQPPCHGGAGQTAEPGPTAGCPPCGADDQLSQCHCCGYAAPAGLISLDLNPAPAPSDSVRLRPRITDRLPESPGDRLYRPPITQS